MIRFFFHEKPTVAEQESYYCGVIRKLAGVAQKKFREQLGGEWENGWLLHEMIQARQEWRRTKIELRKVRKRSKIPWIFLAEAWRARTQRVRSEKKFRDLAAKIDVTWIRSLAADDAIAEA